VSIPCHMRYLRMLSNSVFAGLLASVYLTLLLLHLNPSVPLEAHAVGPLFTVITVSYGLHIAVVSYALYVVRQIAIVEPSAPGWISLRLLTWSAAALSGTAAVITWLHATGLQNALDRQALPGIVYAATSFATSAMVFLVLGLARVAVRRRHRTAVAILFTVATISSIGVPVWLRATRLTPPPDLAPRSSIDPEPVSGPRVVLLCLDGASLDVISPAVAAGRLPNFGRLLDRGASMHLATTRPTQPEPVWASVMTGMWPARHGVRGAARYRPFNGDVAIDVLPDYLFSQALIRLGLLIEEPNTSASLKSLPLWQIAARYGVPTGLIGLPLTHPADSHAGFIVSDRFHRRTDSAAVLDARPAVSPARIDDVARAVLAAEQVEPTGETRVRLDLLPQTGESGSTVEADRLHHLLARQLGSAEPVRLLAVRYAGLDAVGHYYLRYANPDAYGDVSEEERRQFGRVLDDYYAYVDSLVGDALSSLGENDLLLVVSGFGMEPLPFGKRLLERVIGDPRFTGTHERAPDGFLLAYGAPVAPARQARGAVVDVAPTLLYFLGLPVARDMDGFVRTDVFTREFNEQRTITFIPSYGAQ
jgi:predicted AlkP superfamily phosphohydrolase/phosphomutase